MGRYTILILFLAAASCFAYDAKREQNQVGQDVVDASVTQVQDTCIFSNDRQFLRRVAYAESPFRSSKEVDKLGGIWQMTPSYYNETLQSKFASICQRIDSQLTVKYTAFSYIDGDFTVPLYDALATRFYLSITSDPIPWTIEEQADYYVKYYNTEATTSFFIDAAYNIPEPCNSPGADVLFILDGSGSIMTSNFNIMKNFLIDILDNFTISQDDYQIAVMVFSTTVIQQDYIAFNSYNWDVDVLKWKISQLTYPAGGTETNLALDFALSNVFTPAGGVRPDNEGYPRVAIMLTDGESTNPSATAASAARDKDAGLVLFSVGIGTSINPTELNTIASPPTCMHVYILDDFNGLSQGLSYELKAQTCVAPAIIQPNNSVISNIIGQDQFMYFQFSANSSAGMTFQLSMTEGTSALYLATEYSHPSDIQYDFIIPATSSHNSVFISLEQLNQPDVLTYQNAQSSDDDTFTTIYCSIKGFDATNNFAISTFKGYVPTTTSQSTTLPPTTLPTTTLPTTTLPTTTLPSTSLPTTILPTTTLPPTSFPTTTLPPTSLPTTTLPPTSLPTTILPTTTLPTTTLPTTTLPSTSLPTTILPTTTLPPTSFPTTTLPTTTLPPTSLPTTTLPPTSLPTTILPTTTLPTTTLPTATLPTTTFPPTSFPTTILPTTTLPTTTLPPTSLPTTTLPPTSLPTTTLPTTTLPTTTLPTTTLPPTSLPTTTLPPTTLPPTTLPTTTLSTTSQSATLPTTTKPHTNPTVTISQSTTLPTSFAASTSAKLSILFGAIWILSLVYCNF